MPDDEPGLGRAVHQDRRPGHGHRRDDVAPGRARPRVRYSRRDRDIRGDPADPYRGPVADRREHRQGGNPLMAIARTLSRSVLADQVKDRLLEGILSGEYPPDS